MKKLLRSLLVALALLAPAAAPRPADALARSQRAVILSQHGPALDADAAAWKRAVMAKGGTVGKAYAAQLSAYIAGLKSDGTWGKLDVLYVYATENTTQASVDLVARRTGTPQSSPTFTALTGYAGNGSSSYIDSGWNPATMGVNFTQNAAGHFGYIQAPATGTTVSYYGKSVAPGTNIVTRASSTTLQAYANRSSGGALTLTTAAGTTAPGFVYVERPNSSNFFGGVTGSTLTSFSDTSAAPSSVNWYVLAANNGSNVAANFSNGTMALWGAGANLGQSLSTRLYVRTFAFLHAVNATGFPYETETSTWVSNVTGAGAAVSGLQGAGSDMLVKQLKAAAVWATLDSLWLYSVENPTQAKYDIRGGHAHTLGGGFQTFVPTVGYQGALNNNIDTGLAWNGGSQFTQNSASAGTWIVSPTGTVNRNYFGADSKAAMLDNGSGANLEYQINDGAGVPTFAYAGAAGLYHMDRSGAGAAALYKNGSSVATTTDASSAPTATTWKVFSSGGNTNTSDAKLAGFFTGGSLGSAGAASLYAAWHTYQNSENPGAFP